MFRNNEVSSTVFRSPHAGRLEKAQRDLNKKKKNEEKY